MQLSTEYPVILEHITEMTNPDRNLRPLTSELLAKTFSKEAKEKLDMQKKILDLEKRLEDIAVSANTGAAGDSVNAPKTDDTTNPLAQGNDTTTKIGAVDKDAEIFELRRTVLLQRQSLDEKDRVILELRDSLLALKKTVNKRSA